MAELEWRVLLQGATVDLDALEVARLAAARPYVEWLRTRYDEAKLAKDVEAIEALLGFLRKLDREWGRARKLLEEFENGGGA